MSKYFFCFFVSILLQIQAFAVGVDFRPQSMLHKNGIIDILGSWSQGCFVTDEDEDWLTSQLDIEKGEGLSIQWTRRAYEDENCQMPYLDYTSVYSAPSIGNAGELDLRVESVFYFIHSDEVARALNLIAFCGLRNWKKAVVQEVLGRDCDGFLQPELGQIIFSRLKIEMRQSKQILWGHSSKDFDGRSREARFQEFEDKAYLEIRQ